MTIGAGDWVEVRSKEEILATLDEHGRLEGLPFMPQMFDHSPHAGRVSSTFPRQAVDDSRHAE